MCLPWKHLANSFKIRWAKMKILQNGSNKNPGGGQAEHNLETEFVKDNNPWFSQSVSKVCHVLMNKDLENESYFRPG